MIAECLAAEFRVEGDDCPLAEATAKSPVTVDARPPQLRTDGNVLLTFSASTNEAFTELLDADPRLRFLHATAVDGRSNYRCLSKHRCVVHELVDAGFLVESMRYRDGGATMRGAVVGYDVLRGVMEAAGRTVGVTLQQVYPLRAEEGEPVSETWSLTSAQEESIRVALEMGYFELPRETTATEVAEAIGISKTAFLERLRRAQAALFEGLYG